MMVEAKHRSTLKEKLLMFHRRIIQHSLNSHNGVSTEPLQRGEGSLFLQSPQPILLRIVLRFLHNT